MFGDKGMHYHRIVPTTGTGIFRNTPTPRGAPPMFLATIVPHNYFFLVGGLSFYRGGCSETDVPLLFFIIFVILQANIYMKRLLIPMLVVAIIFPFVDISAQTSEVRDSLKIAIEENPGYNFLVDDDKDLVWQKVFIDDASEEDIASMLTANTYFSNIQVASDVISCNVEIPKPKYDAVGFKPSDIHLNARNAPIKGTVRIQFRPGRYRVTVSNIFFGLSNASKTLNALNGGYVGMKVNEAQSNRPADTGWNTLNTIYLNSKKKVKESFYKGMAQTIDYHFNEAFLSKSVTDSEEW